MARPPDVPIPMRFARHLRGSLRADASTRELFACDASIYRRRPLAVLRAMHPGDLEVALAACREGGMPLTMRGAGTSLAGQALGRGLVVDTSALRECGIDPREGTARVQPGVVLADLNAAAAPHGWTFGPDVATANRATLGGMIANNSAGARSIVSGLTADAVTGLEVLLADGTRTWLRRGEPAPAALDGCRALAARWHGPALLRRVSGYNLDALGGERPDWARVICGSEGTLAIVLAAELRLERLPEARGLALVSFGGVQSALDAVPELLGDGPSAVELLDAAMLDPGNRPGATAHLTGFGRGAGAVLVVEHSGPAAGVRAALQRIPGATLVLDPAGQAAVWQVRRSGIARALRGELDGATVAPDAKPLAFIEDPAVPPHRMPAFARELRRLLADEDLPATWYGHASVGCLHIRPLMDLRATGAVARLRRVAEAVADLVVAHDGSLSGEHGDGRLRSELLPRMYPADTIAAFGDLKRALDPQGILNPGVIVDPEPMDAGLRLASSPPLTRHATALAFTPGGLARAAEACNGNAACRADTGAMCPSFQALGDERHSTRGRAVLFRAALEGRLPDGLGDDALHEALRLCLACKACRSECPASVDMARLKVEALAHRHARRGVPLRTRLAARPDRALALAARLPAPARRVGAALAGRMAGRPLPVPAGRWTPSSDAHPTLTLLADTFTRHLHPEVGDAALRVLRATGARVRVLDAGCCGRPQYSQGLVAAARRRLTALAAATPDDGTPIVVLEPSCWSMLVDDARHVAPEDPRVAALGDRVVGFETLLLQLGVPATSGPPVAARTHVHCHTAALGCEGDLAALLERLPGVTPLGSAAGCCGMAGGFGYEHPELSRAIAARRLLPGLEGADAVVASGMSCRHQIEELSPHHPVHPAVFIAQRLTAG